MNCLRLIVVALFFSSISVFSQENNIKHTVVKGESIYSIAKKYNIPTTSIYKLNPNTKSNLQLNQVLLIPNPVSKSTNDLTVTSSNKTTEINHQVLTNETIYGLSKQYKTTAELLYKANPKLETEGLKIGETIIIPSNLNKQEIASLSNSTLQETVETIETATLLTHQVKPRESLYSIAKLYGVSLKELQKSNPIKENKGLSIGQKIIIPSNGKLPENINTVTENKETIPTVTESKENKVSETKEIIPVHGESKEEIIVAKNKETIPVIIEPLNKNIETKIDSQIQTTEIIHEVLTNETKYGIAKKYGISVADLEKQNPSIKHNKLLIGSKLNIQVPNDKTETSTKTEIVESKVQAETQTETTNQTENTTLNLSNQELVDKIIQSASDKIGVRYRTGGTTTAGFDCSGLICTTFADFDIKLPRTSIEQSSFGEKIEDKDVQKGDLIFFKTNGRRRINHVGMVVEVTEDEIKFIHSSTHSGVIISSTKEAYYQRNFAQLNRVIK